MNNRLRLTALLLCLCLMLCLVSCAPLAPETLPPTEPAAPTAPPTEPPTQEQEVSKVIPWGADGAIAKQAMDAGEMIICFMSGEGTKISGGSSSTAFADTKWGDSALIAFPNGELMLIDGGMSDYAPLLIENLQSMGVEKLDYVVLSHRHNDHFGGLLRRGGILETFPIGVVYTSGAYNGEASDPMKLEGMCRELEIPHEIIVQGDVKNIGDVTMEVLWPKPEEVGQYHSTTEQTNNGSLVLRFEYGEISALFTGDLYVTGEKELMNSVDPAKLDADILKIPHHGRHTSSSKGFIEAVSPEIAVATGAIIMETSVYAGFARSGVRVFMDVYDGYVIARTNGTDLTWQCSRVRDVPAYDKLDNAFQIDRFS